MIQTFLDEIIFTRVSKLQLAKYLWISITEKEVKLTVPVFVRQTAETIVLFYFSPCLFYQFIEN